MSDDGPPRDVDGETGDRQTGPKPAGDSPSEPSSASNQGEGTELGGTVDAAEVVTTNQRAEEGAAGKGSGRPALLDVVPVSNDAIPTLSVLHRAGPEDWLFDLLLVLGPVVLVLIAVLGRSIITQVLAGGYVVALVAGVVARALGIDAWR